MASRANAELNNVIAQFDEPERFSPAPADGVVANILSNPLRVLAPLICGLARSGGSVVLSGILAAQRELVAEAYRPWLELQPAHCDTMVDVNCRAPLRLVHALAPAMVRRGRGGVILMSSLSGNVGSAQLAVYAASKAFTLVLADALWAELHSQGVDGAGCTAGIDAHPGMAVLATGGR